MKRLILLLLLVCGLLSAQGKISEMTLADSVAGTDLVELSQSETTKSGTLAQIQAFTLGNAFIQFTGPTTSVKNYTLPNADSILLTDQSTAADLPFTPSGNLAATDVDGALQELDSEKAPLVSPAFTTPNLGTPSALVLTNATGLPAAGVSSGVLAVARLGTGTPDGTKFLRDDGAFVTPSTTCSSVEYVVDATPTGTINGTNDTFTLASAPSLTLGPAILRVNGVVQEAGGVDYTLTASTIVFEAGSIPQTADVMRISYATAGEADCYSPPAVDDVTLETVIGVAQVKDAGINLTSKVTGVLPIANGGTALSSLAANVQSILSAADYAAIRTLLAPFGAADLGTDSVSADELNATGVESELETVLDLPDQQGQISDAQIADGAVDGGSGGEIADGSVNSADLAAPNKTVTISFAISDPATADSHNIQWLAPAAVTITAINCSTDTGTADIELEERVLTTPNTAGTAVMGADLQCDNNNAQDTSFSNAGISSGALLSLEVAAVASSPTQLRVHVTYTID